MDGHTEAVFASTDQPVSLESARSALAGYDGGLKSANLPSAPVRSILVRNEPDRPQPRLDRNADDGMATVVGRLRQDPALNNGIKYVLVSHNTKMGAAKGAVPTRRATCPPRQDWLTFGRTSPESTPSTLIETTHQSALASS